MQRSPLSAFPVESAVPGVIGYFQVDAAGTLTTPLLPDGRRCGRELRHRARRRGARGPSASREFSEVLAAQSARAAARATSCRRRARRESSALRLDAQDVAPTAALVVARRRRFDRLAAAAAPAQAAGAGFVARRRQPTPRASSAAGARLQRASPESARAARSDLRRQRPRKPTTAEARRGNPRRRAGGRRRPPRRKSTPSPRSASSSPCARSRARSIRSSRRARHGTSRAVPQRLARRPALRAGCAGRSRSFVAAAVEAPYRASSLGSASRLDVAFQGRVLDRLAGRRAARYASAAGGARGLGPAPRAAVAAVRRHRARVSRRCACRARRAPRCSPGSP